MVSNMNGENVVGYTGIRCSEIRSFVVFQTSAGLASLAKRLLVGFGCVFRGVVAFCSGSYTSQATEYIGDSEQKVDG